MPKSKVSDLITDQEMAFVRLVLSGTMNDHAAARTVDLNPDTAAYTKAKPRVRAYMLEHRAVIVDSCPCARFRCRQACPIPYRKALYLAPETLKRTHALQMPPNAQKGRILSKFTKSKRGG